MKKRGIACLLAAAFLLVSCVDRGREGVSIVVTPIGEGRDMPANMPATVTAYHPTVGASSLTQVVVKAGGKRSEEPAWFRLWRESCGLPDGVRLLSCDEWDNGEEGTSSDGSGSGVAYSRAPTKIRITANLSSAFADELAADGGELLMASLVRTLIELRDPDVTEASVTVDGKPVPGFTPVWTAAMVDGIVMIEAEPLPGALVQYKPEDEEM